MQDKILFQIIIRPEVFHVIVIPFNYIRGMYPVNGITQYIRFLDLRTLSVILDLAVTLDIHQVNMMIQVIERIDTEKTDRYAARKQTSRKLFRKMYLFQNFEEYFEMLLIMSLNGLLYKFYI